MGNDILRSSDDIVIAATGSITAVAPNPKEEHEAAKEGRSGLRELTSDDILSFELMCKVKGLTTEAEKQEFFRCLWGAKCGVGGVIPKEWIPDPRSGFFPEGFVKKGEFTVGRPVVQSFVAFAQVRDKLPQLFSDGGRVRADLAPETMIDIANGAGSSVEMVERELLRMLDAPVDERIGSQYGGKWLLGMLGNMGSGQIASAAGIEGAQSSSNSACASSGISMYNAWNAIRAGSADVAVVGGSEFATGTVSSYVSFDHMMFKRGALSRDWRKYGPASQALRAFDALRDGFVPGDAAVLMVIMRRRIADLLKIEPKAQILGVASNTCQSERYGKSLADGTITGQSNLLRRLIAKSGIDLRHFPGRIVHYLHGTGTKVGGINEVYASARVFGDIAKDGRYSATGTKGRTGHTLSAAFAANAVEGLEAMRDGVVAGISAGGVDPALRVVDPVVVGREDVEIDPKSLEAVADSIHCGRNGSIGKNDIVIADAKGFGGTNSGMAFKSEK